MTEPARLSKHLAAQVGCSRSEAERYIEGGWVRVNGVVEQSPRVLITDQQVELDADASLTSVDPVSVLLHQAADQTIPLILSATQHWSKFPTTTAPLPAHLVRQTCPIPLLKGASGLVVLTQDWRFARTLKDDQHQLEQEYIVDVTGQLHPDGLKQLSQALRQQSTTRSSCKVSWQSENRLRFALKAPQDHQIQHQCAQVGLQVTAMRRIRIGAVSMGKLPLHHWMYLSPKQRF